MRRHVLLLIRTAIVAAAACVTATALAQAPDPQSALTWIGRETELEKYLESAEVLNMKELGVGVTRPHRATLAPGGPVDAMVWKPIKPGQYAGRWESYKSEIAAYELDKFFGLGMIPPTVEREVRGVVGAAVMWVSPAQSFKDLGGVPGQKGVKAPPPALAGRWNLQLIRAKMLDNLIGNPDPNLGNWMVDPSWNLILIDHSRSFTTSRNLYHQMTSVDMALWEKMEALDEPTLTGVVGKWLDRTAIRNMLERRDKMRDVVAKLKR